MRFSWSYFFRLRPSSAALFGLFFGFFAPFVAYAALIDKLSAPCMKCGNCTLEDGLIVAGNMMLFGIEFVSALVLVMVVYGGVLLVASHGNEGLIERGKSAIVNAFKGLFFFLLAWTIVNFIIGGLSTDKGIFGQSWYTYQDPKPKECAAPPPPPAETTPVENLPQGADANVGNWTMRGVNYPEKQKADASPSLAALINCLNTKIEGGIVINSISDDDVYTGNCELTKCNEQAEQAGQCDANNNPSNPSRPCANDNKCAHTCGSCHYAFGQAEGTRFSEAVDIASNGVNYTKEDIEEAADECDSGNGFIDESASKHHYHVSTSNCDGD